MFDKIEIIRRLLGILVVAIGSFGCAFQLYRFSRGQTRPVPVVTLLIIGSTALLTGLQFVFPEVSDRASTQSRGITGGRVVANGDAALHKS